MSNKVGVEHQPDKCTSNFIIYQSWPKKHITMAYVNLGGPLFFFGGGWVGNKAIILMLLIMGNHSPRAKNFRYLKYRNPEPYKDYSRLFLGMGFPLHKPYPYSGNIGEASPVQPGRLLAVLPPRSATCYRCEGLRNRTKSWKCKEGESGGFTGHPLVLEIFQIFEAKHGVRYFSWHCCCY